MRALAEKFVLVVGIGTVVLLAMILLPKFDSPLADSLGSGIATTLRFLGIVLLIIVGLVIVIVAAVAIVKIKHMGTTHVIYDPKDGRPVRAVIHKGELVQLAPGGADLLEVMKIQQQQAIHMQQHWKMIGTATTSMRKFMDEYEVGDEDGEEGVVVGTVDTKLLEGPRDTDHKPDTIYTLSDQLKNQQTVIDEGESIIGYANGEAICGPLFGEENNMMDSIFVAGDQGFGKSVFAVYMHALNILHGGRTLVIDPDAELKQSLTNRLGPLASPEFLMCPVASTPESALRLLAIAQDQIDDPDLYPILLLVDEFSLIMRALQNEGKWTPVAKKLQDVVENWATRGRKRKRRAIVFGQITKATRSGGTELRDSMTSVCFHLKKERAARIMERDVAELAPTLKTGQVLIIPARSADFSYLLQLPYPDNEALAKIAQIMLKTGLYGPTDETDDGSQEQPNLDEKAEFSRVPDRQTGPLAHGAKLTLSPLQKQVPAGPQLSPETQFVPGPNDGVFSPAQETEFLTRYKKNPMPVKAILRQMNGGQGLGNRYSRYANWCLERSGLKKEGEQ